MRPEDRLRSRCRAYLTDALPPPAFYSSIEHGRPHAGTPDQRRNEWTRLKAQGVKTGLADIFIWYRSIFVAIELKAGKNDTSEKQDAFAAAMEANGFRYQVIRSVAALDAYLRTVMPIERSMAVAALHHDAELTKPEKARSTTYRPPMKAKPPAAALKALARARKGGVFA